MLRARFLLSQIENAGAEALRCRIEGFRAMSEAMEATVYRVCAGPASTWNVFADAANEPVAAFHEKSAAVRYAMDLARGRVSWRVLLGTAADSEFARPLHS